MEVWDGKEDQPAEVVCQYRSTRSLFQSLAVAAARRQTRYGIGEMIPALNLVLYQIDCCLSPLPLFFSCMVRVTTPQPQCWVYHTKQGLGTTAGLLSQRSYCEEGRSACSLHVQGIHPRKLVTRPYFVRTVVEIRDPRRRIAT